MTANPTKERILCPICADKNNNGCFAELVHKNNCKEWFGKPIHKNNCEEIKEHGVIWNFLGERNFPLLAWAMENCGY